MSHLAWEVIGFTVRQTLCKLLITGEFSFDAVGSSIAKLRCPNHSRSTNLVILNQGGGKKNSTSSLTWWMSVSRIPVRGWWCPSTPTPRDPSFRAGPWCKSQDMPPSQAFKVLTWAERICSAKYPGGNPKKKTWRFNPSARWRPARSLFSVPGLFGLGLCPKLFESMELFLRQKKEPQAGPKYWWFWLSKVGQVVAFWRGGRKSPQLFPSLFATTLCLSPHPS